MVKINYVLLLLFTIATTNCTKKQPLYAMVGLVRDAVVKTTNTNNLSKKFEPLKIFAQRSTANQSLRLFTAVEKFEKECTDNSNRPLSPIQKEIFEEAKISIKLGNIQKMFKK